MTEYRKVYAYHEKNDGMYELKSYWTSSETTQFESGENLEEYRSTTENNINLKADRIEYDLDAGMLYLYSDETKIDEIPFRISIKPKVNLGDIDDLQITQDNSAIKLSWDDPIDIEFSGLKIVEWAGTKVVRKEGSCPDSIEDGTLVIDNKTRNAYSSTPYSDSGLVNGVEYYYRFFPYDTEGNIIGDTCGEIIRVITLVPIEIPTVAGTYTYTGDMITPTFVNYDSEKMTRSGANSAKNAGTYTVTFTPKEGYMWVDTTVEAKEVTWTINPATISVVPSQSGTLTYNEQSQNPTWSNYNSSQLTISGDTSGTNAGNYTAVFTPKANYVWEDGSVSKSATWSIEKASIQLTASMNSVSIYEEDSISITLGGCQYGYMTAGTEDPNVISTSINGSTLTINGINQGTTRVTIWESNVPAEVRANYSFKAVSINIVIKEVPIYDWVVISTLPDGSSSSYLTNPVVYNNELYSLYKQSLRKFNNTNNEWSTVSSEPNYTTSGSSTVAFDDNLYVIGGLSDMSTKIYKWDGANWIFVINIPYSFRNAKVVVYNNEIHLFGGDSSSSYYNHYKYDGNSISKASSISDYNFKYSAVVVYNDEIHVFGGGTSNSTMSKHYKWNGIEWTSVETMPYNICDASCVVYNNEVHLIGNMEGKYNQHISWNGNEWKAYPDLPSYFQKYNGVVYNNEIHLVGGDTYSPNKHYKWVQTN